MAKKVEVIRATSSNVCCPICSAPCGLVASSGGTKDGTKKRYYCQDHGIEFSTKSVWGITLDGELKLFNEELIAKIKEVFEDGKRLGNKEAANKRIESTVNFHCACK